MSDIEHTPTPWQQSHRKCPDGGYRTQIYDAAGDEIATLAWYPVHSGDGSISTAREANAAFIVRAVNAYDDLINALDDATRALEQAGDHESAGRAGYAIAKADGDIP